jgi:hypothetical protein
MLKIRWRLAFGLVSLAASLLLTLPASAAALGGSHVDLSAGASKGLEVIWPNLPLLDNIWPNCFIND